MKEFLNKIHNGSCVDKLDELPESCVDLVVTSPPYNVGIPYDTCIDDIPMGDYWLFTEAWLAGVYRVLKDDGRIALNIPYEINVRERGGRIFFASEYWNIMKEIGFNFYGIVDLEEESPHRSKTTAWGSWMSPSSPYIYNPKECVILAYKKDNKKHIKGEPEWTPQDIVMVDKPDGKGQKKKIIYSEEDKKEFMQLVFGQWKYMADTSSLTKATFSLDIPEKAIKILTYKEDTVLDPFMGSGTTAIACLRTNRNYIGIELSSNYMEKANDRINKYKEELITLKK